MSKEKEEEINPFKSFSFLDSPTEVVGVTVEDKTTSIQPEDGDLSEEDLEALNKAAEAQAKAKEKKTVVEKEEAPKKETKTKTKPESKEKEEVLEEEEETEEEEVETPEVVEEEEEGTFKPFLTHMANKGILDYEDSEEIEDSEDGIETVVKKTVENRIKDWKQSYPEDAQKFLEFVENGGNPSDFHKYYYSDASFEKFDISTEENQKYVLEQALKLEGLSDEEIQDEINDAVDLGKLEKKAGIHLKKLQKIETEQKEALLEAQKEYSKKQEVEKKEAFENFKKGLFEKEQISGFKFTPKMKQDLWDYMTKPINKKTGETQYQVDSKSNEEARYIFAYLLKNKWDVKSLEKQVESKAVSKLKSKLSNYTDSRQKIGKTASTKIEAEGNNPFEAFKKII